MSEVPDQCPTCGGFNGPGHKHEPYVDHKAEIVKAAIRFWWAQPRPIPGTGRFSGDLEELSDAEGELLEAVKAYRAQWKNLQR